MATAGDTPALDPAKIDAVLDLFQAAGHALVSPPMLQPANVLLDLIGEDIRRRLYLTQGADGADLCLRPDFTIPVCRHHVEHGDNALPTGYCYHGPVFRQRPDGLGEIPQMGAESLGRTDIAEADADLLALAIEALSTFGLEDVSIRIGDETIFAAVLAGLGLPAVWQRRLRDLFGETDKLAAAVERMAGVTTSDDETRDVRLGFLAALEGADPKAAHAVVEDLLSIAGISAVGGRTPAEIADRFLEHFGLANLSDMPGLAEMKAAGLLDLSMPGASGSIAAACSRSATCIRHSSGQKVFSRMNSVSTAIAACFRQAEHSSAN